MTKKDKQKETVPIHVSLDIALCVSKAAADEGISPEEWVEGVVLLRLLENSGYRSLEAYMKDNITEVNR